MTGCGTKLDVVVVNFHSARLIGRTIEIVREFAGAGARLIMVDNSPGDGAAEHVRAADPEALVVANTVNRGYAAAVNQAVAVADADLLLLLNPDIGGISGSYFDVLNAFRDPCVGAVVARLLNSDGTLQPSCIRAPRPFDLISEDLAFAARFPTWQRPRQYRMLDWDHREARPVDAARGACLFIRRGAIADVGPFDEFFFLYYEETDWLIRAKRRGWRTVFLPTVEAVHTSAGSSPDARSRNDLLLLESQHRYARKHFGPATTALLRTTQLGIDTARLARHALSGRGEARAAAADRIRVHLTMRAPRPS
jgi:N-acetylglucosaminyl-diphospho-decaprenol L-rhamnosyltransferase